jgi:hypothetical protein
MNWKNGEPGPTCFCGMPTAVSATKTGAVLVCIFHEKSAGAFFPLPKDRPDNWPNLSDDEMILLVDKGTAEADATEDEENDGCCHSGCGCDDIN